MKIRKRPTRTLPIRLLRATLRHLDEVAVRTGLSHEKLRT